MTIWQYKIVDDWKDGEDYAYTEMTVDKLDALGAEGWELVCQRPRANGMQWFFKRPLPTG